MVKNPPANTGYMSSIPGLARSLEKEMATHSSILAWEIPWTEESGTWGPWGSWGHRVRQDLATEQQWQQDNTQWFQGLRYRYLLEDHFQPTTEVMKVFSAEALRHERSLGAGEEGQRG